MKTLAVLILAAMTLGVSHAEEITFVASGQVTWITPGGNDFDGYLGNPVQIGDELRFVFTFESTTPGRAPYAGRPYMIYEAIKNVRVEVSGNVLSFVPCGNCAHRILIEDDDPGSGGFWDIYQVSAIQLDPRDGRSPLAVLQLGSFSSTTPITSLTSTRLPVVPPDAAAFTESVLRLSYGSGMQIDVGHVSTLRILPEDTDEDGIGDNIDNCRLVANVNQTDTDADGLGDACDEDDDNDGVVDGSDNCRLVRNADQSNVDGDTFGDVCDGDIDGDDFENALDNCQVAANPDQTDTDRDGAGDECDANDDNDSLPDINDNCPSVPNDDQGDLDADQIGDVCDADLDGDGVNNTDDNCPIDMNRSQDDTDRDGVGDVCDSDDDADGLADRADNCPLTPNGGQEDSDLDGAGDVCDNDLDGDNIVNAIDNCRYIANSGQADFDYDSVGDACDSDVDGDGVVNAADLCASTPSGGRTDKDGCTIEQLCPCDGPSGTVIPWRNHGKYVSCVAQIANRFLAEARITSTQHGTIVSAAGQSDCGGKR